METFFLCLLSLLRKPTEEQQLYRRCRSPMPVQCGCAWVLARACVYADFGIQCVYNVHVVEYHYLYRLEVVKNVRKNV